jgi:hypothetical protein
MADTISAMPQMSRASPGATACDAVRERGLEAALPVLREPPRDVLPVLRLFATDHVPFGSAGTIECLSRADALAPVSRREYIPTRVPGRL